MKTWVRAPLDLACGSCTHEIKKGTPLLEIEHDGRRRARCPTCAKRMFGEDPPADFPEAPVLPSRPAPPVSFHTPREVMAAMRRADYRRRQSGDVS